ncbi:hypothetical protein F444_03488, partial [Phytophthora nicotianae P1976]
GERWGEEAKTVPRRGPAKRGTEAAQSEDLRRCGQLMDH